MVEPRLDHFAPLSRSVVTEAYKALLRQPLDPEANGRMAMVLHGHEMYSAAIPYYRRAEELAPEDFQWPYLQSRCLFFTASADEELQALRRAQQRKSDYEPLLHAMGECLTRLGRTTEAQQQFDRLTNQSPDSASAWLGLGQTFVAESRWVEAEGALRQAVAKAPEARSPHYLLATVLTKLDREAEAKAELVALSELTEELPRIEDEILGQALRLGIGREAMDAFNHAGDLEAQGQWREAQTAYEQILRLNPEYVPALCQLGAIFGRLGKLNDAQQILARARQLDPRHAYSASNLGWMLSQLGEHSEAIPHLQSAIKMDPFLIDAYLSLAIAFRETGQVEKAVDTLKAAAATGVNQPMIYYLLAEIQRQNGKVNEAIETLREGIRRGDSSGELARYLQQIEAEQAVTNAP